MNNRPLDVCARMRALRLREFGPRGKAQFAKRLGIRASTYQQYESTRVPPVELLARVAETTHCDLVWLLTGSGSPESARMPAGSDSEPLVDRVRDLIRRRPETVQSLTAFVTLIDGSPPDESQTDTTQTDAGRADAGRADAGRADAGRAGTWQARSEMDGASSTAPTRSASTRTWIPILGSTAAGTARFWKELSPLVAEQKAWSDEASDRIQRLLNESAERPRSASARLRVDATGPALDATAALVQFSQPDAQGIVEFLNCVALAERSRLVAWRIDGESMWPRYADGDFVLVSPDTPAVEGYACVAHQRGQIGVNCKIFQRDRSDVVLIPVNERHEPQRFPVRELAWAHRVLYSVRLAARDRMD